MELRCYVCSLQPRHSVKIRKSNIQIKWNIVHSNAHLACESLFAWMIPRVWSCLVSSSEVSTSLWEKRDQKKIWEALLFPLNWSASLPHWAWIFHISKLKSSSNCFGSLKNCAFIFKQVNHSVLILFSFHHIFFYFRNSKHTILAQKVSIQEETGVAENWRTQQNIPVAETKKYFTW